MGEGKPVEVFSEGGKVQVGPSSVSLSTVGSADNLATNGVVHIIDEVLLPPSVPSKDKTIVELAESVEDLSTLVGALVGGDLVDTLSGDGPFTVFAPTNEAFAKLPAGTLDDLMKPENKDQLVDILTYHVVPGNNKAHDFTYFQKLTTVEGKPVEVFSEGGKVQVGPSSVSLSTVGSADNLATNGVVHIIDEVLLPPSVPSKDKTIVELAESVDSLSTLVAALVGGGLVDTLSGEGPFTVFAPTNDAFAKLPAGTLDDLMKLRTRISWWTSSPTMSCQAR